MDILTTAVIRTVVVEREQVLKYFESLTQISIEERDGEMELRGGKLVEAEKTCR